MQTDDRRAADGQKPGQTVLDVAAASQIADPMLSRLYAYWNGKRGGKPFPGRSDLDPVDIPLLLPSIFLVEVHHDPFDLMFRLAGTVLTGCYGSELTGRSLIELPSTRASDLFREAARTVHAGHPVLLSGPVTTLAESYRRAEHLLLPLGECPDRVDMLVGGAIFRAYPVGERPDHARGHQTIARRPETRMTFGRFRRELGASTVAAPGLVDTADGL